MVYLKHNKQQQKVKTMIDKLLRENNGWKDVAINWVVMITILMPMGAFGMLGFLWISLKILGAI
jgi:hypothetical protein